MTIGKKVHNWAHVKSDVTERGDPLCRFFTRTQTCRLSRFFSLLQLDRLQLTVVCCNRRWVWTPHLTRPFFTVNYMHTHGSSLGPHSFHHIHASCALCERCVWLLSLRRLHFPLPAHHLLSYHPVLPSHRQLHLPGCGGQIPCALPSMRTLALLPSTTLSHKQEDLWLEREEEKKEE